MQLSLKKLDVDKSSSANEKRAVLLIKIKQKYRKSTKNITSGRSEKKLRQKRKQYYRRRLQKENTRNREKKTFVKDKREYTRKQRANQSSECRAEKVTSEAAV